MTEKNGLAIDMANLGVCYGGRWVLRGFNLEVRPGEKVSLSGPSGSGKSTVLRCALGLVVPDEGAISIRGAPLDGQTVWTLRHQMAYVAQEPDLGTGTVRQAIERPFAYKANAHLRANLERLPALLERFRLAGDLLDKESASLSGGEKQRVALVSAILLDRPMLLLDEASSALDKDNRQTVVEFIRQARDLTVLSVSHDAEWMGACDRVVDLIHRDTRQENHR
jgi:ABC-type multidrug transport system ATPase subunit